MVSMLKKVFEVNFFSPNVFVPVLALALYCGSFAYYSAHFLPEGVNYFFASRLGKYAAIITVSLIPVIFVILKAQKARLTFNHPNNKFYPGDFLLLLLPLTPMLQYVLNNQELLSLQESLCILISGMLFASIYIFVIPALLRSFIPTQTLMILGLAFVFTVVSMASLSDYFTWFVKGRFRTQMLFFGGVFLLVWVLYNLNKRGFLHLLIVVNLVANSSAQVLSQGGADDPSLSMEENRLLMLVGERTPAITPNIYFLVYDAYVSNETMLAYGIDNSPQEDYLTEQGFELYPHTYSIGATTLATLSKVLNVSRGYYGEQRRAVSGDGIAQNILKSLGYETYGLFVSDYMFRGVGEKYDFSIPAASEPSSIRLLKAILIGEFRFDLDDMEFQGQARSRFIENKQRIFEGISGNRVFVFMYTNVPGHSQTSGVCLPNQIDLFKERLASANFEMQRDLKTIIANDPDAIVIVAGDHGPYLTKNCMTTSGAYDISEISRLDIQDRHGTFLAIRWPTGNFENYDDITVLQDLFPAIFAYIYQDPAILGSKIEPEILTSSTISGVSVVDGVIDGGINDGEPLFLSDE